MGLGLHLVCIYMCMPATYATVLPGPHRLWHRGNVHRGPCFAPEHQAWSRPIVNRQLRRVGACLQTLGHGGALFGLLLVLQVAGMAALGEFMRSKVPAPEESNTQMDEKDAEKDADFANFEGGEGSTVSTRHPPPAPCAAPLKQHNGG